MTNYSGFISKASAQYGVDPELLKAVLSAESGGNALAKSPAGAQGLMQLMPGTAAELGVTNPYDPEQNISGGANYLSQMLKAYGGDVSKALAAYNWGPGNLSKNPDSASWPKETQDYVAKITGQSTGQSTVQGKGSEGLKLEDLMEEGTPTSSPEGLRLGDLIDDAGTISSAPSGGGLSIPQPVKDFGRYAADTAMRLGREEVEFLKSKDTPVAPLFMESFKRSGESIADVGLGVLEAPVGLASGAAAFGLGALASSGEAAKSVLNVGSPGWDPWGNLAKAKDILDKTLETTMWMPSTKTGQYPLGVISKVFEEGHRYTEDFVRYVSDPKLSEEELNKRIKGSQYLFDIATLGIGALAKGRKGGKVVVKDELKKARRVIKEKVPDAPAEGIDAALKATKEVIVKQQAELRKAKVVENQGMADALRTAAVEKEGYGKAAYKKIADRVEQLDVPVDQAFIDGLGRDPNKGTRGFLSRFLKEQEGVKSVESVEVKAPETSSPSPAPVAKKPSSELKLEDVKDTGIDPGLPTKLTEAVDKPGQVKTLEQMGVTEPKAQVGHIIKDSIDQHLDAANGLEARGGHPEKVVELRAKALENGEKLKAADGSITERLVDTAISEKMPKAPIMEFDSPAMAKGEGLEIRDKRSFSTEESVRRAANEKGTGFVPVKIGERFRIAKEIEAPIAEFKTLVEAKESVDVMSEISKERAEIEALNPEGPEFGVLKVGDKYYRSVVKAELLKRLQKKREIAEVEKIKDRELEPSVEELRTEEAALREDLARLEKEIVQEKGAEKKTRTPEELGQLYEDYRNRYVTKFNKANQTSSMPEARVFDKFNIDHLNEFINKYKELRGVKKDTKLIREMRESGNQKIFSTETGKQAFKELGYNQVEGEVKAKPKSKKVEKPEELGIVDDGFIPFDTREAAEAYRDASGNTGREILGPDPKTGKFYLEPDLGKLEDLRWEVEPLESMRDRSVEDVEGSWDLSETGRRDLWDIIGNERGSVELPFDLTTLRNLREKIRYIEATAEGMKMSTLDFVRDVLKMEGVSLEGTMNLLMAKSRISEELKKKDGVVEGIFYPEGKITQQIVKATREGSIIKDVPITVKNENMLRVVPKDTGWGRGLVGRYMALTEIPLAAFKRFGLEEIWWDWTKQERQRKDWVKNETAEVRKLRKSFSRKERAEMAIYAYFQMENGPMILEGMGITEIPKLTAKQEKGLEWFKPKHDQIYDNVNYVRGHVGAKPLKKTENYFTWQRQINTMKEHGAYDGMQNTSPQRFAQVGKEFRLKFNPFAVERVKHNLPLELDIFGNYEKYVETMSKELFIAPIAAKAKKLAFARVPAKAGKGGGTSFAKLNPEAARLLDRWSEDIMGVSVLKEFNKRYPALQAASSYIHRSLVASILLGKTNTVVKQISALTGTHAEVGLGFTLYGIGRAAVEKPTAKFRGVQTRAKEMGDILTIRRSDYYFDQIHEMWMKGDMSNIKHSAAELAGFMMNLVDSFTAEASWNAFYDHAKIVRKMSDEQAIRFADERVVYTQSVGVKGATAPIQNIPGLELGVIFQSFAITDFNYIARELMGIKNADIKANPKQFIKVARYIVAAYAMNQLFHLMGTDPPHPSPIKEFEESQEGGDSYTLSGIKALLEFGEKLPLIGGPLKYGSSLLGPAGELAGDIPEAFKYAVEMTDWDRMSDAQRFNRALFVAEILGTAYGIPMTRQLKQSIRAASQDAEWWQIILGVYEKEKKGGTAGPINPIQSLPGGPTSPF